MATLSDVTSFNVTTGDNSNYPNPPAWGLSYHLNDVETPVLKLVRGTTYTFRIMVSSCGGGGVQLVSVATSAAVGLSITKLMPVPAVAAGG